MPGKGGEEGRREGEGEEWEEKGEEERRGGEGGRKVKEDVIGLKQSVTNCFNAYKSGECHHPNACKDISSKNLTCRSSCTDNHWTALNSKGRDRGLSLLLHRADAGVHAQVTPAPAV